MNVYGYGDQGLDDSGWGCVYRNVQSLLSLFFETVPTLPQMREMLGIPFSTNAREMWIEPDEAQQLLFKLVPEIRTTSVIYSPLGSTRTHAYAAERIYECLLDFHRTICSSSFPVLVDNGRSSYLILACQRDGYLIADPHFLNQSKRVRQMAYEEFYKSDEWMALLVHSFVSPF